jgi:hypothetical protein
LAHGIVQKPGVHGGVTAMSTGRRRSGAGQSRLEPGIRR